MQMQSADLTPSTPEELAAALADAAKSRTPVVPWGAGQHQHLGAAPPPGALRLRTAGLSRVLDYTPADLTITVEAGATLAAIQETMRPNGQWLPWDPPGAALATVGGLLAARQSGPLRLGYGAPRDWLIGMRAALGDGRLVKSGGRVVKNVAGFDAHKLHIGALGTLGVIVEVTFKLTPLPERIETHLLACPTREAALGLADTLRAPPLSPVSLALVSHPPAALAGALPDRGPLLAARFAGVPGAVERHARAAAAAAAQVGAELVSLDAAQGELLWDSVAAFPLRFEDGALLRCGAPPAELPALLGALERHAPGAHQAAAFPGVGLAYARWLFIDDLPPTAIARSLAALRAEHAELGGYAVVEGASEALRAALDLWGPPPATLPIMRALKAQWDPANILNPGRYVAGI